MTYDAYPSETDPPAFGPVWPHAKSAALRHSSPWANPGICDRVKALWCDHSASEIQTVLQAEFGIKISRNAVIGRLHRVNLTVDHKTRIHPLTSIRLAPRAPVTPKPRSAYKAYPRRLDAPPRPRVRHDSPELKAMRCAEITPLNLTFEQLTTETCKWPYNDELPFVFCGHKPLKDRPYCPAHCALGTKPTRGAS